MTNVLAVQGHPIGVVERIAAESNFENLVFTYSRYHVAPPGLQAAAPRTPTLRVSGPQMTAEWLERSLSELGPNEELAWHSLVESNGMDFHIPMIDFQGSFPDSKINKLQSLLISEIDLPFIFFRTGRSLHGYSAKLIPERLWSRYLGKLLLLNEHDAEALVDTRWIGHALTRGFAALRWSHNTSRYLSIPHLVEVYS